MTAKQLLGSMYSPDGSLYITLTDGNGNLVANSTGTVTSVSVVNANGVSGSVATPSTTPAITLSLGSITPTAVIASGSISAGTVVVTNRYSVTSLPVSVTGARAYVTDASSPTFLGLLTGGGTTKTPVFYNGSAWIVG